METDYNLLFGVACLQNRFISTEQFVEVCTLWASAQNRVSLADILVDRGWLSLADHSLVARLVARQLITEHIDGDTETADMIYQPLTLEEVGKAHIQRTLEFTRWNKSQTASILGIERSTLDRKIKLYNLRPH